MRESMTTPRVYAVRHQDESIRAASRSGGFFTAVSDWVLEHDGVVYGCVLTEDFQAVHVRADRTELRNLMRGSKYIQSELCFSPGHHAKLRAFTAFSAGMTGI